MLGRAVELKTRPRTFCWTDLSHFSAGTRCGMVPWPRQREEKALTMGIARLAIERIATPNAGGGGSLVSLPHQEPHANSQRSAGDVVRLSAGHGRHTGGEVDRHAVSHPTEKRAVVQSMQGEKKGWKPRIITQCTARSSDGSGRSRHITYGYLYISVYRSTYILLLLPEIWCCII